MLSPPGQPDYSPLEVEGATSGVAGDLPGSCNKYTHVDS